MSGLALKLADKTFNGADATTVTSGFGPDRYEWNDSGLGWTHLQVISVSMTIKAAPGSPSGLKAAPKSSQTVELSWDDPGDESITKYQYRKSENGGVSWLPDWSDIASSDKDTNSHMVSGLTIGTEHTFSVRAVNDAGSGSAASITITPGEDLDDDDDGLIQVSNLVWYVGMRQTDPTWVEENRGPAWSSHPILIEPEQLPGPIAPASCKEGPTRKGRRSHRRYRWKENRWKENRDS